MHLTTYCASCWLILRAVLSIDKVRYLLRAAAPVCLQYDVELVQKIEALLGHQLVSYALPEKEVLMGITKVYSARRKAVMRVGEEESRAELKGRRSTKRKRGPQSEQ